MSEERKYPLPQWVRKLLEAAAATSRKIAREQRDFTRRVMEAAAKEQHKREEEAMSKERELDWAVWEKVFGHCLIGTQEIVEGVIPVMEAGGLPRYSTDIAPAMGVIEKMREKGWRVSLDSSVEGSNYEWHVEFNRAAGPSGGSFGVSLPETICRAAVAAVQQEKGEGPVACVEIHDGMEMETSPERSSAVEVDGRLKALYMLVRGADMKTDGPAIAAQSLLFPSLGAAQSWAMVHGAPPPARAYIVKLPIELIVFSAEPKGEEKGDDDGE